MENPFFMKERRQYYRLETDIPATIRKKDSSVPARIANISIAGAYIITKTPIRSGKQIELCFQLPRPPDQRRPVKETAPDLSDSSGDLIACSAKIRWTAEMKTYHAGVEFVEINRIDRYKIAGFIKVSLRKMSLRRDMTRNNKRDG